MGYMYKISVGRFTPLVLAILAIAACDKNPLALRHPAEGNPFSSLAADGGSIPQTVIDAGKLISYSLIPGFPDLSRTCTAGGGSIVTGVAFGPNFIFVAHGGFANSCITRYNRITGAYLDQKNFRPDFRGLHFVPALGKYVGRAYGALGTGLNAAEIGRFFTIDYFAGTSVLLTNYNVQTCNDQGQPGVDPDGLGYWINCGSALEHHRMSDGALLTSVATSPFFPGTNPVWAGPDAVILPSGAANQYAIYDPATGAFRGNVSTVSSNGCGGYGLGAVNQGDGGLVGVNLDCTNVRIETVGNTSHGPLTGYPGTLFTGHITLCKAIDSPAGNYGFSISSHGVIAGDVVQTTALMNPGQCQIVFSRTAFSNIAATLTITEVSAPGTVVHSITRTQFGTTTVFAGPSRTIMVSANSSHGGLVTYKNIAGAPPG